MPTITVKVSNPDFSRLQAMATASRRTKSEIVREALAAHIGGNSTSLLDAMQPYIGKLSGPGDLSTNKARMKGYGGSRSR
jgi:Ribbon-helix-helix protein, copG family